MRRFRDDKKSGFTLIELIMVIVILALLVLLISNSVIKIIDNSRESISETQEKAIVNAAEKWAVDNSHVFDDVEGTVSQIGLDVMFILDVTGSMTSNITGGTMTRYKAMVDAVNNAMNILQGDMNRMGIYGYSTTGTEFLNLDTYTSTDGLFLVSGSSKISTTTSLRKNGSPVSPVKNISITGNTNIQLGLVNGGNLLVTVPHAEAEKRIPVVIFLTDGEANQSSTTLCTLPGTVCGTSSANMTATTGFSSAHFHLALLAGYEYQQKIANNYSGSSTVFFYTIGLGVSDANSKKLLDPISNAKTSNYNYVTKSFVNGNMTADDLKDIFSNIATEVVEATKVTELCITVEQLIADGYLTKGDVKLANNQATSEYVLVSYNEVMNQFAFNLAKTAEQKATCRALLETP